MGLLFTLFGTLFSNLYRIKKQLFIFGASPIKRKMMLNSLLFPDKYARIGNQFVFNARYRLPAREQKIILYILSKVNPNSGSEFHKQRLSVAELQDLLVREGGKYGSFYNELLTIADVVTNCKITFPTRFEVNGVRLKGSINWFQHCIPVEDEQGQRQG